MHNAGQKISAQLLTFDWSFILWFFDHLASETIILRPFIGLQTRYNLLDRSLEFDLQPACAELDVGILPWGIVAEGFLTGKYTRESGCFKTRSSRTVTQLEENLKTLEFKLTPEQMKRLDEVSKPAEIPFPHSYTYIFDRHLGKNIEVPKKFEPVASAYNFGRINNNY
ncbi:unnamed protein product [Rhizophagus irregularis]|nr:unnamed protein product [Rhizophagus irregularis]